MILKVLIKNIIIIITLIINILLLDDTDLKNDTRFVKLWIEYADMVRTPGEIFTFMQVNKIGKMNSF